MCRICCALRFRSKKGAFCPRQSCGRLVRGVAAWPAQTENWAACGAPDCSCASWPKPNYVPSFSGRPTKVSSYMLDIISEETASIPLLLCEGGTDARNTLGLL